MHKRSDLQQSAEWLAGLRPRRRDWVMLLAWWAMVLIAAALGALG